MNRFYKRECESSCEYSLPDYMGDVKKILSVSASVIPSGKFASDGQVQFSGVISYDVLYSDFEGKLTHLTASSDYDVSVPADSEGYVDSFADTRVANLSVRLTGPRKLVAKAIVSSAVSVEAESAVECSGDAFSQGNSPEVATEEISVKCAVFGTSPEREYAEEAERFLGIGAEDVEIIATSGAVRIIESTAVDGGVSVKGELIITSIVRTESQPPFAIKKVIPFEETVSVEGVSPDMQTFADGYLSSVTSGVSDNDDGCSLTVNAIAELTCRAAKNKSVSVVTDAYVKERDTAASYEDYSYATLVAMGNSEPAFAASVMRSEVGCEQIRDILTLGCEIRSFDKKIAPSGFEICGDAAFSGIACEINDENKPTYLPIKFSSPFSVNVNCGCQIPENAEIEASVRALDTDFSLDAEKITVKSSLKVAYSVAEGNTLTRLSECSLCGEEEYRSRLSTVTVYYPENSESLFSVAKKFHTTVAKIAEDNKLSEQTLAASNKEGVLSGVKRLIIR